MDDGESVTAAIVNIAWGLGCIAIGALGLAGVIPGPLWIKVAAFPLGAFTVWFGAMAFWWA